MNQTEESKSIHAFDFNLICEYFSGVKRQGPGSEEATLRGLGFIEGLDCNSRIADIGCGTGTQALTLARHTEGQITAVDLFPQFTECLRLRVERAGLSARVKTITADMAALPFAVNEFDVIWSEGAIYNIGFKRGMEEWWKYLKRGGHIAVTEATWLTNDRPHEIEDFWNEAYPEIDTIHHKVAVMQDAGYVPEAVFLLPDICWTENFYIPQEENQKGYLLRHRDNQMAAELVRNQRHEAEMYSLYHSYYGYVFYIGKKM